MKRILLALIATAALAACGSMMKSVNNECKKKSLVLVAVLLRCLVVSFERASPQCPLVWISCTALPRIREPTLSQRNFMGFVGFFVFATRA
jgi:hypothetical protein